MPFRPDYYEGVGEGPISPKKKALRNTWMAPEVLSSVFTIDVGALLSQCEECGKSYSVASQDSHADIKTCVMCRLQLVKERDSKTTGPSNVPDDR